MYRSLLLALSLFFITMASKAAVFVVTSNADSGPGTLREALTLAAANGSAEKDYINFNLPNLSEAGRTITLESELPHCSSNLVIDGTTQPGSKFQVSDAKVSIVAHREVYRVPLYESACFTIRNIDHVAIYGMFIVNFYDLISDNFPSSGSIVSTGILIYGSNNIVVGAPGKGNMFRQNTTDIFASETDYSTQDFPSDITVQSNYMGCMDDKGYYYPGSLVYFGDNLIFGGDNDIQGNHVLGAVWIVGGKDNRIIHNAFDFDFNGNPIHQQDINILPIIEGGGNNMLVANNTWGTLKVDLFGASGFRFISNKAVEGGTIDMYDCHDGTIGTDDISLLNNLETTRITTNQCTNIEIRKNSIICSLEPFLIYNPKSDIPDLNLLVSNDTEFSGTASPGSDVYIYNDNTNCEVCNPVEFFKQVTADATGNWKITGNFINKKLLANATLKQNSSEYTLPGIAYDPDGVVSSTCGKKNGSIKLRATKQVLKIEWFDASTNQKIGEGMQITGLGAGTYYAKGSNNKCSAQTGNINVGDFIPQINDSQIQTVNPACGTGGAITQLYLNGYPQSITYSWRDKAQTEVGHELDVFDLKEGEYTLTVKIGEGCEVKYGPVILKNATGPTIDDSKPNITNTNCGQAIGAINNILVSGGTGTRHFMWKNEQQQEVAYTQDLTGQPAGKYTLQVTDGSSCGPVYSREIEIAEANGITLTESTTPTTPASCGKANGAVSGVTATGGVKYEWRDVNGNVVGNNIDLTGVPGGGYQLTVSNAFCQKQSKVYQVLEQSATVFPSTYTVNHIDACYGVPDGALQVNQDVLIKAVRWVNSAGVDVGMHNGVTGLPVGSYKLYLTDQNGCESYYNTYQVAQLPEYTVADRGQTNNETCGLKNGYINNVTITGGLPPYTYKWLNTNGEQIGSTNSISNLAAGNYTLNIVDSRCGDVFIPYTIQNIPQDLPAPSVSDLQVCSPGDALFFVNNPAPNGIYRLYDQLNSTSPLSEKTGGSFKLSVTSNRSFFVSQVSGTCESALSEIKVSVGLSTLNIANTFSPNGDGQNDYWKINGIESYPQAVVQIFNRNGQKLFESKGYGTPFNGTYKGKPLPIGTYFYIINLNKNCNLLSGSLTIIR